MPGANQSPNRSEHCARQLSGAWSVQLGCARLEPGRWYAPGTGGPAPWMPLILRAAGNPCCRR